MRPASPGVAAAEGHSSGKGGPVPEMSCVAVLQEALSATQALGGVQQHVQRLARSNEEAVRRAETVEVCRHALLSCAPTRSVRQPCCSRGVWPAGAAA